MPRRIALKLRYDGTGFHGSQIQPGQRTVAGTLKNELELLTGAAVALQFAGRTDAGVHANGNVCAFDAELGFPTENLATVLNARLPQDLEVRSAWDCAADFHPRFDARLREYRYRLFLGTDVPVEKRRYYAVWPGKWSARRIASALKALSGEHLFHRYCAGSLAREQSRCRITAELLDGPVGEAELRFRGDRFLHNMICRLVSATLAHSEGRITLTDLRAALKGERRFQLKPAPPQGLVLEDVYYGQEALVL